MSYGRNRALPGKARLFHMRSRAARMSAAQRISEAFDSDGMGGEIDRFIPIKRRAAFLPTADSNLQDSHVAGEQLELALSEMAEQRVEPVNPLCGGSSPGDFSLDELAKAEPVVIQAATAAVPAKPEPRHVTVPEQRTGFTVGFSLSRNKAASESSTFSARGFLRGCLIGSAVAGAVLLILYWLFA